jgi:hypothetical protein
MNRAELRKLIDLYSRNQIVWGDFVRGIEALSTSKQAGEEPVAYSDSTPRLHIGDSAFEDWYQNYLPNSVGHKQIARDAYAAGMGDPSVTAAPGAAIAAREQEAAINPAVLREVLGYAGHWAAFEEKRGNTLDAQRVRNVIASLESPKEAPATPPAAIPAAPSDANEVQLLPWQAITEDDLSEYERFLVGEGVKNAGFFPVDANRLANIALHCIREVRATRAALTQPTTVQQAGLPSSLPLPSDEAINEMAFQHELIAEGSWNEDAVAFGRELLQPYAAELERLRGLINTPHTDDFFTAINLEAAHQIERFGDKHDQGKTPTDWLFLIGYLAGKAATSFIRGDAEKGKHHIVSSGAVLLNWWRHATGVHTEFRPGHGGE